MDLVRNAFRTDTDQTFSGQIEKAMQLTKKQASYCYSYGTELPAAEGICNDISAKYGAVRNPFERLETFRNCVFVVLFDPLVKKHPQIAASDHGPKNV